MTSRVTTALALLVLPIAACLDDAELAVDDELELAAPAPPLGLMLRSGVPPATQQLITSSVAMIDWADIQPTGPGELVWTTLDRTIDRLVAAGVQRIRIRLMSGGHAPLWVKRLGAPDPARPWFQGAIPTSTIQCSSTGPADRRYGGVAVQNVQGPAACVPFFWTKAYLDAYAALMTGLRRHLDGDAARGPRVSSIVDSACMAIYAEVFYRGQGNGMTNKTLFDAGLTHAADVACQRRAIAIHRDVFANTRRTSVAINDWDIVQGTPGPSGKYHTMVWNAGGAPWATHDFVEWARAELDFGAGTLLELQNNGLHTTSRCPAGDTPATDYFCYLASYAGRHGFQTQSYEPTPRTPSGASLTLLEDLDRALELHAQYVELPGGMTAADWAKAACYHRHIVQRDWTACPH